MRKFEGNINGKIYTDESEFDKALLLIDDSGDMYVSYRYVSVPDSNNNTKSEDIKNEVECNKNYVSENQYVKNITNQKDIKISAELESAIKNASNKSDIKETVSKKITYFDNKISNNLLHINDLKSDYKKLEEKIKLIESQIKTLDDANNNYYLNKEYYTNINDLLVEVEPFEIKEECGCKDGECTCGCDDCKCADDKIKSLSIEDICNMTPYELTEYIKKMKVCSLSDLVDCFLKKY
jgi:hypothetical protein